MSGIYIHIPFCTQKCNYCNFHFSTLLKNKPELIECLNQELVLRKNELTNQKIESIYLGGGTPSILTSHELDSIFNTINKNYFISDSCEVTLEANPDDLTKEYISYLKNFTPINRLSIGIQSFFDKDLKLMNRAHNSQQAINCIEWAQNAGFQNISIDLIYGGQTTSDQQWIDNLKQALVLNIPHISSYALTVEPKTVFESNIKKGKLQPINEEKQLKHFEILRTFLIENNFIQYEFSNFGKEGFFSKHNTSYWKNKAYLGIGPSAHSFDGKKTRSWNISNNNKYIKSIKQQIIPCEKESIDEKDTYNETIMLGLRTMWGINIMEIENMFSSNIILHFHKEIKYLESINKIIINENVITINPKYLFQTDGIISQLFFID